MFGIVRPLLGVSGTYWQAGPYPLQSVNDLVAVGTPIITISFLSTPDIFEDSGKINVAVPNLSSGTLDISIVPIVWTNNRDYDSSAKFTVSPPTISSGSLTVSLVLVSYLYQRDVYPDIVGIGVPSLPSGTLELRGIHYVSQRDTYPDGGMFSVPSITAGSLTQQE